MEVVYSSKALNTHVPDYKDQEDHSQGINEFWVSLLSQKLVAMMVLLIKAG